MLLFGENLTRLDFHVCPCRLKLTKKNLTDTKNTSVKAMLLCHIQKQNEIENPVLPLLIKTNSQPTDTAPTPCRQTEHLLKTVDTAF